MENQHAYRSGDNRPEFISFSVPRLGLEYDFLGFWEYPARAGWHIHRYDRRCHANYCPPGMCRMSKNHEGQPDPYGLHTPGLSRVAGGEATCHEKVAFLQTWLFFGALAEAQAVCNLPFSRDDYSVDFFNTAHLNGLPLRLYLASQSLSSDERKMLKEKLYAIARQVQLMITRVSEVDDEEDYTLVQCEVLYSIQILLRILALALLCHSHQPFLDLKVDLKLNIADPSQDWKCEGQMSMIKFEYERLLGNGWCKSELSHLLGGFDVSIAACYLNRPYAIKNHDTCSETTCLAYQISESSYRTLHVDNCECGFVYVDQAKLKDALSKNKIPKIVVTDELQLSVVEGEEVDYIAFSHVCKFKLFTLLLGAHSVC